MNNHHMPGSPTVDQRPDPRRVLVVSIDGVAPRFATPERMPNLTALVRSGGGCFTARTIVPPITRPVHASMLRGVGPSRHGVVDNRLEPIGKVSGRAGDLVAPSFLAVAREAGLTTASFTNWPQIETVIEPKASAYRLSVDGGYDPSDDDLIVDMVGHIEARRGPQVSFVYLCYPDVAGHDHGWGSPQYLQALTQVDATFGRLAAAVGDTDIVVTTDHGGLERGHSEAVDEIMQTFVAVRSERLKSGSFWGEVSVLDIAPTVADLAGFESDETWEGRSLIGRETPMVDHLLGLLVETEQHHYGEGLSMLAHSLQAAAEMEQVEADDELVVAALLHDVGHLMGTTGAFGFPDHAEVAAQFLRPWFPATVTDPIRLHVAAKKHLVGTDRSYVEKLSHASRVTLEQQGGPFSPDESKAFLDEPHATRAMTLRRCDDAGKRPEIKVKPVNAYRERLAAALATGPIDPSWARDACRCGECRDAVSDQHLIDVADVEGWTVLGSRRRSGGGLEVRLRRNGVEHIAKIPTAIGSSATNKALWPAHFELAARRRSAEDVAAIALDVTQLGVAYITGVPTVEGAVLSLAATLGQVRETNYGRLFDVRTEPAANNLAYTPLGLPLHTDNPYRDPVPTVQILHCVQRATRGGGTLLADGFGAAEALRSDDPASFDILSNTMVTFRFHDDQVDLQARRTVIDCGPDGGIHAIHLNNRSLDTPSNESYRAALGAFVDVLSRFTIELTLDNGEAIAFDNRRILHARTGFDATSGRHLQGCYIDIDALHSTALRSTTQQSTGVLAN